jgi:dimethylhistidine N-methyltransferase
METLSPTDTEARLVDYEPDDDDFQAAVLEGLNRSPKKTLPTKFLYDERGSTLFDQICETEEYYPTRTEIAIMKEHGASIAETVGPQALIVEYGSGTSLKTRLLLKALRAPVAYVPIDIARRHLLDAAERMQDEFPNIPVFPVCADYMADFDLPDTGAEARQTVAYFPGSTIGNMEPEIAVRFMRSVVERHGAGSGLLIGVDLKKDRDTLEAAYNDEAGMTASFNLNLLHRINRELGGDFDPDAFDFRATYNPDEGRVESHLISQADQDVRLNGQAFSFDEGEKIHTENSYKYTPDEFADLAGEAGYAPRRVWTDEDDLFSVQYLVAEREV